MRVVYHAEHIVDAYLVKGLLESIGIPSFVPGEYLVGAMGELPVLGLVAVSVPDRLEADALTALKGWREDGTLGATPDLDADPAGWALA